MNKEKEFLEYLDANPNKFDRLFSAMFNLWALHDNTIRDLGQPRFIKIANECLRESVVKKLENKPSDNE